MVTDAARGVTGIGPAPRIAVNGSSVAGAFGGSSLPSGGVYFWTGNAASAGKTPEIFFAASSSNTLIDDGAMGCARPVASLR
jgi:hypothetical protein